MSGREAGITPELRAAIEAAERMASALQRVVVDAIESSGDQGAAGDLQELLRDWGEAHAAARLGWQHQAAAADSDSGDCLIDKL